MKLSLISEADFEKRTAQRMGGSKYVAQLLRTGEITLDDVKAAAALGHLGAVEYVGLYSKNIPNWSRPREMSKDIYSKDKLQELINVLLNLSGQSLSKIKQYTKKHWNELNKQQQESLKNGLGVFKEALAHCRTPERPMSHQLQQDFDTYGTISNWSLYWSRITSSLALPIKGGFRGDYDTNKIGQETNYNDPKSHDVSTFEGSDSPFLRRFERPSKELHPAIMVMGSLAQAIDAIETLTQYNLITARESHTVDQVMINQVGRAIEGLTPIIGKNAVQKRLMSVVAPAL
jgi:hypothetical protein